MITFTKNLLPINPAYNDSIIEFQSTSIINVTKATLVINGTTFNSIPFQGKFTFNFKEIIKSVINSNNFEDIIIPNLSTGQYIHDDYNTVKNLSVTITVFGSNGNESTTRTYTFIRGVEQLIDYNRMAAINPSVRILLPASNYVDYHVKYFEGYPFDFTVYGITPFQTFYLKNVTTNQSTVSATTSNAYAKRFFISDGTNTTTNTDILVQSSTLNKTELWVNNVFKANIYIHKVPSDCGVYLKWINSKGSYSYWKFDSAYKGTLTPKTIDDFGGKYDNLQNLISTSYLIGKTATQILQLSTSFDVIYAPYLSDLGTSPAVWMYIHDEPFQKQGQYDFVGVRVNDSAIPNVDTKINKGRMNLTITLPQVNTMTN